MKKEYLDYLYEHRALVMADVERLEKEIKESSKDPIIAIESINANKTEAELRIRKSQLYSVNKIIENYLDTHASTSSPLVKFDDIIEGLKGNQNTSNHKY